VLRPELVHQASRLLLLAHIVLIMTSCGRLEHRDSRISFSLRLCSDLEIVVRNAQNQTQPELTGHGAPPETARPRLSKIPLRSSSSYAAITISIGTPNSTGQRCA
jgi:hypothetical protein